MLGLSLGAFICFLQFGVLRTSRWQHLAERKKRADPRLGLEVLRGPDSPGVEESENK